MKPVKIILLLIVTTSTMGLFSQTQVARIKFDKTTHDFGRIKEGDKVMTTYTFTNIGGSPLVIRDVELCPECTLLKAWKKTAILPGRKSEISIIFDSKNLSEKQKKTIIIHCNTKKKKETLSFTAQVIPRHAKIAATEDNAKLPIDVNKRVVIVQDETYENELELMAEATQKMDIQVQKEEKIRIKIEEEIKELIHERKIAEEGLKQQIESQRNKKRDKNKKLQTAKQEVRVAEVKERLKKKKERLALIKEKREIAGKKSIEKRRKKEIEIQERLKARDLIQKNKRIQRKNVKKIVEESKLESEQINQEKTQIEAERIAKKEATRLAEAERRAKEEAARLVEAQRQTQIEAERIAKEKARLEAERRAIEEAKIKAKKEAELEVIRLTKENERLKKEAAKQAKFETELKLERLSKENERLKEEADKRLKFKEEKEFWPEAQKSEKENTELKKENRFKLGQFLKNNKPPTRRVVQTKKRALERNKHGAEIESYLNEIAKYEALIIDEVYKLKRESKKGKLTLRKKRKREAKIQNYKNKVENLRFVISQLKKE